MVLIRTSLNILFIGLSKLMIEQLLKIHQIYGLVILAFAFRMLVGNVSEFKNMCEKVCNEA